MKIKYPDHRNAYVNQAIKKKINEKRREKRVVIHVFAQSEND